MTMTLSLSHLSPQLIKEFFIKLKFLCFSESPQIDLYEFLTESELQHYYNAVK